MRWCDESDTEVARDQDEDGGACRYWWASEERRAGVDCDDAEAIHEHPGFRHGRWV